MTDILRGGKILWIVLLAVSFSFRPADRPEEKYIAEYKDLAIAEMHRTGIPASIKLAQALVESNSGQSVLASRANNHFGIKCKSYWDGGRYFYADDDRDANGRLVPSCFRRYDNPVASYADHSDFLLHSGRYDQLFDISSTDYIKWARGLKRCGYATDPSYADKLIRTIETFDLSQWDQAD